MTEPTIIKAIRAINPDAQVSVRNKDIDRITWVDGTTPIAKAAIQTKLNELQAAYDALEYSRNRAEEYPSLKEFTEAYTEKEIGGDSTKWDAYVAKYNLVRSNNPKP